MQNYEVPKKKYEIVKPQIDDEFDKQVGLKKWNF